MNEQTKRPWQSTAIWGGVLNSLSFVIAIMTLSNKIPAEYGKVIFEYLSYLGGAIGTTLVIYGRTKADTKISWRKQNSESWPQQPS